MDFLRIGAVPVDVPSAKIGTCGRRGDENGTFYVFDPSLDLQCRTKPGFGLEIALFLSTLIKSTYPHVRFIPGDGWSPTPTGMSLVQRANRGEFDYSMAEMAYTESRAELISYSQPTLFSSGPCFLVCGSGRFVRYSRFGISQKLLVGGKPLFAYIIIATSLIFLRLFELRLRIRPRQTTPTENFHESLNVVLSKPDVTFAGTLQSRFVFALVLLVFLKGTFKGGLMHNFTPERKFSFNSIADIANAIEREHWVIGVQSRSYAVYNILFSAKKLYPIATALKASPPVIIAEEFDGLHQFFSTYDKALFFGKPNNIFSKFRGNNLVNCICHALDYSMSVIEQGIIMSKDNIKMQEFVNLRVSELREFGFLKRLAKKYGMLQGRVIDSEILEYHGLSLTALPKGAPIEAFIDVFLFFILAHFTSALVLISELHYRSTYR